MLAIRMQRTGRKGHAQFRLIVQDSRRSPKSGNIVFALGSYDPHSKQVTLDKEKTSFYLENGAQPSTRVAVLLKKEGVKLPDWVALADKKKSGIKNTEKLRRNRPAEEAAPVSEKPAEEAVEAPDAETPAEEPAKEEVVETPEAEAPAAEAEEAKTEE